jgi:hypothetical protein
VPEWSLAEVGELKPRITVFGVGGAGGNAVNNMINAGLQGAEFVVANTDAQALTMSRAERIIQMGVQATEGLSAGSQPDVGRAAAEEVIDEIRDHLTGAHMAFVTAGMGGGTGRLAGGGARRTRIGHPHRRGGHQAAPAVPAPRPDGGQRPGWSAGRDWRCFMTGRPFPSGNQLTRAAAQACS